MFAILKVCAIGLQLRFMKQDQSIFMFAQEDGSTFSEQKHIGIMTHLLASL